MMTMATAPGDPNYLYEAITNLMRYIEEEDRGLELSWEQAHALFEVLPATLVKGAEKWSQPKPCLVHRECRGL